MIMTNFIRSKKGSAGIEFGILAPVLIIMLIGIIYFGFIIKSTVQMQNAVEAGALYAIGNSADTSGIQSVVQNATTLSGITVTISTYCECANGVRPACNATCGDGSNLAPYTQVQGQKTIPGISVFPGMTNNWVITKTSTMRTG